MTLPSADFGRPRKTLDFFGRLRTSLGIFSLQKSQHSEDKNLMLISQKKLAGIRWTHCPPENIFELGCRTMRIDYSSLNCRCLRLLLSLSLLKIREQMLWLWTDVYSEWLLLRGRDDNTKSSTQPFHLHLIANCRNVRGLG